MAQAIERLAIVSFFSAIAAWMLNDIRRHLREGEFRSWPSWGVRSGLLFAAETQLLIGAR